MNKIYISLGSNKGPSLKNIQGSVVQIQKNIGILTDLSSLYQTPAWGFQGTDFLNACIGIKTVLSPKNVLHKLLEIEKQLGRVRSTESGYISRTIDLDLLFYGDQIIESEDLMLPHPRLELRNFVLFPMVELAPDFIHPRLGKNMTALSKVSPDTSQFQKMSLSEWSPDLFSENKLLVFEGNIGVGKTSLSQKIAENYQVTALQENFNKNPYLEKFYVYPERFALPVEKYFLEERFRQFNDFSKLPLSKKVAVADHSMFKSLIFAKINLSPLAFVDFKKNYTKLSSQWAEPNRVIFLHQSIDKLMAQIKARGRPYEQNISEKYLRKIAKGYENHMKSESGPSYQIIDLTDLDFVNEERAYQIILQRIKSF
jgi:2-amino-4-hydroxy-6-hydroxymethyldihydropteridine diphosphokinase